MRLGRSGQRSPQVTDSGGESVSQTVNVTVNPAVVNYCSSRGYNTNYEWINSVGVGPYIKSSGANSGYIDFTSENAIALSRGSNNVSLSPGFRYSSYYEN